MSDFLGRVPIPDPVDSLATINPLPITAASLISDWDFAYSQARPVVHHSFGSANCKVEQRFEVGIGPAKYGFRIKKLSRARYVALKTFWEARKGAWEVFTYNAPQPDGTTFPVKVNFSQEPLSFEHFVNGVSVGLTFVEVPNPSHAPAYSITGTPLTGFPSSELNAALLAQVQKIIPLIHIRPKECDVAVNPLDDNMFLSDRLCTVGGQKYLARLLNVGDAQGDTILSSDMSGNPENVRFVFGNADRVMTKLANDTRLRNARIEFSLYHVNSGILLNEWAGEIMDYEGNAGAEFVVQCSDPLWDPNEMFPVREVSRQCYKNVGDGITCHATPGSACDRSWANCGTLGRQSEFGGIVATPQGFIGADHRIGSVGFPRNTLTPTSIVSDTIEGYPLPEIWANDGGDPLKSVPVNCLIAAVRFEDVFNPALDALAIVGTGPLGAYTVPQMIDPGGTGKKTLMISPTLDGSPFRGFHVDKNGEKTSEYTTVSSLRQILGADPVVDTGPDHGYFSIGPGIPQVWSDTHRAAGVAFIEIRISQPAGGSPSAPESHQVQTVISQGLTARKWTAPGSRVDEAGCINPFWVAVNTLLRGKGVYLADSATQEEYFDAAAALYCAGIAGNPVALLFGSGTEPQFSFQGVIGANGTGVKSLRQVIAEDILPNGLGYFTWSFGRMRLGIRINASATEAFTLGNILYGSLSLRPIKPRWEKMVVSFADQEYRYQANTATYTDWDLARLNGRPLTPTKSPLHLMGCASKSSAARIALIRTREECGGCYQPTLGNPWIEYNQACEGSWKSTILALNTIPGTVVSLTHDDLKSTYNTTGFLKFRVQGRRLMRDWSVQFDVRTVTESMYDLTVGPKPSDVPASPIPVEPGTGTGTGTGTNPPAFIWSPGYALPVTGDKLVTGDGFGVQPKYTPLADGSSNASILIKGNPPVNMVSTLVGAPTIKVSVVPGGGTVLAGDYAVCAVAFDAATSNRYYGVGPLSNIEKVNVAEDGAALVVTAVSATAGGSGLTDDIDGSSTDIPVGDGTQYEAGEMLVIGDELLGPVSAIIDNVLSVTARGVGGTVAAAHTAGDSVSITAWPGVEGTNFGGDVFVSKLASADDSPGTTRDNAWHYELHVTASETGGTIESILGAAAGAPDALFDNFVIRPQKVEHSGVFAEQVVVAATATTITFAPPTDFTTDQFAGRVAILLAHADTSKEIELAHLPIASNDANTLTVAGGVADLTAFVEIGDLFTVSIQPTAVTDGGFSDDAFLNAFWPTGMAVHEERGRIAFIWAGTGAGQSRVISENAAGAGPITLASKWDVNPDETSVIFILNAQQFDAYRTESIKVPNKLAFSGVVGQPDVINLANAVWLLSAYTASAQNGISANAAQRLVFLFGDPGSGVGGDSGIALPMGDGIEIPVTY